MHGLSDQPSLILPPVRVFAFLPAPTRQPGEALKILLVQNWHGMSRLRSAFPAAANGKRSADAGTLGYLCSWHRSESARQLAFNEAAGPSFLLVVHGMDDQPSFFLAPFRVLSFLPDLARQLGDWRGIGKSARAELARLV